jgi:DNA-binding NtrC family response regulator
MDMLYKILIVDDEPANLRTLARLFREDYEVLTAESGDDALALLDQHDVALLITDQRMPGMTGIELLKKTVPLRPRMVRIILTGYTDVDALVEAINCGQVYRYVAKPWDNEELRLTVKRALEHYEASKQRHELGSVNARLVSRLGEIQQLAALDKCGYPESVL